MDAIVMIRVGMAKLKINADYQLAERIGLTRQILGKRLKTPSTFKPKEIVALANLFGWSNEELGEFLRLI